MEFTQSHASHIGITHSRERVNCQDAATSRTIEIAELSIQLGLVCDGCGSTLAPEVGVKSAMIFIPKIFKGILSKHTAQSIAEKPWQIVDEGYSAIQRRITAIAVEMGAEDEAEFDQIIFDHFMFTIVGYLITPWHLVTFRAGDGIHVVNSTMYNAIAPDAPSYLGHTLISDGNPHKVNLEQEGFQKKVFHLDSVQRVLACTDAFASGKAKDFISQQVWTYQTCAQLQGGLTGLYNTQATFDDMAIAKAAR